MQIQWQGLGLFCISGKVGSEEVTVITDPYKEDFGLRPPRTIAAQMVAQSHDGPMANNVDIATAVEDHNLFIVTHAGEFESSGIFINGINAPKKDGSAHTIYRIFLEEMSVAFLGALDRPLTDAEVEALGDVHILLVPVGGTDVLSGEEAAALVAQVEPRLVIPYAFSVEGEDSSHVTEDKFIRSLGIARKDETKFKIAKSALPEEDTELVVLSRT